MDNVFVIIPAYNEASAVGAVVEGVRAQGYRVVVVDDASRDATAQIAKQSGAHVVSHPVNLGQGAALQTGIDYALAYNATQLVTFDADGQHQASDIALLMSALHSCKADIALGSRFSGSAVGMDTRRRALLKLSALFSRVMTGTYISDTQNGLRAMTAGAARRIRIRQNRFAHALEIIAQVSQMKLIYVEVPVTIVYTAYSRSKGQSLWSSAGIMIDLWLARMRQW